MESNLNALPMVIFRTVMNGAQNQTKQNELAKLNKNGTINRTIVAIERDEIYRIVDNWTGNI